VIDSLGGGPDILGVCEVENRYVLEQLIQTKKLKDKEYDIVHANSPDKRGIDVALLYRKESFKPLFQQMIRVSIESDPDFITRDIMMVKGLMAGKEIYFFVNHWPSRRGGESDSRPRRIAAAKAARFSIDTILKRNANAHIMLMGDYNDEPADKSIVDHLKAEQNMDKAKGNSLFNTMAPLKKDGQGSHFYKDEYSMLDQIIVSSSLLNSKSEIQYVVNSSTIYKPVWMHDKYYKDKVAPYRTYVGPKFIGGYSDHFPVFCKILVKN
jgi:predicted extracellular nuclease